MLSENLFDFHLYGLRQLERTLISPFSNRPKMLIFFIFPDTSGQINVINKIVNHIQLSMLAVRNTSSPIKLAVKLNLH